MAQIALKNLGKVFPPDVVAVEGVDITIADGEFFVLLGPSGCGKSTLLRMIAGLEAITSGRLWIDDRVVNDLAPKDRDIAMVFQSYALYPHLSVYENLAFGLRLRGMSPQEVAPRVAAAAQISAVQRRLRRHLIHAFPEECLPVIRLHFVQRRHEVCPRIGQLSPVAVIHSEECLREVIQRLLTSGLFTDQRVGIHPDQLAFRIVVLATLPVLPREGAPRSDYRIHRRVCQRPPVASRARVEDRRVVRDEVKRLLLRDEAGPRRKNMSPVLGLTFIDPEQAVAHGAIVVRRPQIGRAAELAIPRVHDLVRQQVPVIQRLVPLNEVAAADSVFARSVSAASPGRWKAALRA